MSLNPITTPNAFDFFMIDGDFCPGLSKIISGGGKKLKVEDQGQPLTMGANTVVRLVENTVVTYGFKLWLPYHFEQRDKWQAMFLANGSRYNPKVYNIIDPRVPWLKKVIYEDVQPQGNEAPGGPWTWTITLHEWNRMKVAGGAVRPKSALEQAIEDTSKANAVLNKELEAMKAKTKAGKK